MCLILLHWQPRAERRLIVAANRDEFLQRPTDAAHFWKDQPHILAGRDREFGGSWLGVSLNGRFAAVTNLRDTDDVGELSRGNLVQDFLNSHMGAAEFVENLEENKGDYRPFNLIVSDLNQLAYSNNAEPGWRQLDEGIHVLGNIRLSNSNPKVRKGAADFSESLADPADHEGLFDLLRDSEPALNSKEPLERALSCRFVNAPSYGTRSSSVLLWNRDGSGDFWEREYSAQFDVVTTRHFALPPSSPP